MNSTALIITTSMAEIATQHGFRLDTWKFLGADDIACTYRGFSIGLMIPNGGIIGVSFWCGVNVNFNGFSKLTEHLKTFPGYENKDGHVDLAKAAIDAILGPEPEQLSLLGE